MILHGDHLLPETETPLNKALAAVSTRLDDINAPSREIWNPWTCPPEFLKVLAHAFSVDLWRDDWTEARKRSIIANAIAMHRAKGTLYGLEQYLRYTDGVLKGLTTRPQRVFCGPALSREEREAYLRKLPQVRVYKPHERSKRGAAFHNGGKGYKAFFETAFLLPSTAHERYDQRAVWVTGGQETDLRVSEYGSYFRLHRRANAGPGVYSNQLRGRSYFLPSTAQSRLYTIAPQSRLAWRSPVRPSLRAIKSEPELIRDRGKAGAGVYANRLRGKSFYLPSTALRRVYHRYPVSDGSRAPRPVALHFNDTRRFDFPAHTALLALSIPGKQPRWAAGEGLKVRHCYWLPRIKRRVGLAHEALRAAKRQSDRILINHIGPPRLLAGTRPFIAGEDSFVIGYPNRRD